VALETAFAPDAGARFVAELQRIWNQGNAALPVDHRLPGPAQRSLLKSMRVGEDVLPGDALVLATSGTTGAPKGVTLTHDAIAASAASSSSRLQVDPQTDRWLACLPLAHIGGLGVVLRALWSGTPVDVHPGFDAQTVDASSATLVSLVPAVLARIDTTRFRTILLGGSAIPADRPTNTVATYGMTETGGGIYYGRAALDAVEIRAGDSGEIEVRGPMLFRSYRSPVPGDVLGEDPRGEDRWFGTGDLGSFDDGVLQVSGRAGDLIVTGGENVWPGPVEAILRRHGAVADVAVIGRPDATWGQRVVAVVEVVEGTEAPLREELREMVASELPVFCAPKAVEVVTSLPRTALGKIRRVAL